MIADLYAQGARFDVIPAFDGYRLVWPQRNGSLLYLEDELGRSLIFSDPKVARRFAELAEREASEIITKIRGK